MKAARYLATIVGEAHARQLDRSSRQEWRNQLARDRSCDLDAPSWLWSSVVELVANHEAAYLEHCRDRKSTRLNSSHVESSYAVFCLKKKKNLITYQVFLLKINFYNYLCTY